MAESRPVFGFGIPASLATAYHVKPFPRRGESVPECQEAPLAGGRLQPVGILAAPCGGFPRAAGALPPSPTV
jgi:hypothetical protein